MIKYIAARHKDVIIVVSAPGPVAMDWASHANITAILYTYFPTTEAGTAIASVLFGDVSPSGKLPFTLAKKVSDYPVNKYDGPIKSNPVAKFSEGVFLDYKVRPSVRTSLAILTNLACSTSSRRASNLSTPTASE